MFGLQSVLVHVAYLAAINDEVRSISQRLNEVHLRHERYHQERVNQALAEKQNLCLQSFKLPGGYERPKERLPKPVPGTCEWMPQTRQYVRWKNSRHSELLFLFLDPGSGKSVLSKSIVDSLIAPSSATTVCYYFFKHGEQECTLSAALCAILHQLFSQQPHLIRHATSPWDSNGKSFGRTHMSFGGF
jgi:hypothetical protein